MAVACDLTKSEKCETNIVHIHIMFIYTIIESYLKQSTWTIYDDTGKHSDQ